VVAQSITATPRAVCGALLFGALRRIALAALLALMWAGAVLAHPHGTASCNVKLGFTEGRVTQADVTLELDEERSREAFAAMQAAPDGSAAPQQRARLAFNLHLVFAQLNYLTTVSAGDTPIALRPTQPPIISRLPDGRMGITATLVRAQAGEGAREDRLTVHCADPSWYWLVGFNRAAQVTSNRTCDTTLGDAFQFALPQNLPKTDAPSIAVTSDNTPTSQTVRVMCNG
jgi:ABC-type uncharacterized transport system substrate-binding protein